jgi:glutamate synthase (ferredoxin)
MANITSVTDTEEIEFVKNLVFRHAENTGSQRATDVLVSWDEWLPRFVRVIPHDYGRVLEAQKQMLEKGMPQEVAEMAAFELNSHSLARAAGK